MNMVIATHSRRVAFLACIAVSLLIDGWTARAQTIPREPDAYRPDEIKIGLQRMSCFGSCPVYSLTITGDGAVKYFGSQFVGVEGAREERISPEQVALLVNEFLRTRFFDLPSTYDGGEKVEWRDGKYLRFGTTISDVPSVMLSLELGQRKKQILLRYQYPAELKDLAGLVDTATQSRRWTAQ